MKNKKLFALFLSLSIMIFIVIILLSLTDGKKSGVQSSEFTDALKPILPPSSIVDGENATTPYYDTNTFKGFIRKLFGHFGLFFGFALSVNMTFVQTKLKKHIMLISSFGIGLFTAILSELVQLIPQERGPRFQDVLIDSSGYLLCIVVFVIIFIIDQRLLKKKENK